LPQHGIHQGGLAMVHVRNDSDITNALRHWITAKKGLRARSLHP
jgi:hypothetical protein